MTQRYDLARRASASNDQSTTAFQNRAAPPQGLKARCRMAMALGTGAHLTQEIACLLRRRLRIAALIMCAGFGVSLTRALLERPEEQWLGPLDLGILAAVVALLAAVTTVLWSRLPIPFLWLPGLQLTLSGAAAAYFAWTTLAACHDP